MRQSTYPTYPVHSGYHASNEYDHAATYDRAIYDHQNNYDHQSSYEHAGEYNHATVPSAARVVASYGVYREPPPPDYRSTYRDRDRERERELLRNDIPLHHSYAHVPSQRAHVYRAVVDASGHSSVLRPNTAFERAHLQNNESSNSNHGTSTQNTQSQPSAVAQEPQTQQPQPQPTTRAPEASPRESPKKQWWWWKRKKRPTETPTGNRLSLIDLSCRPPILLLILTLATTIFVLAIGITLYFHFIHNEFRPKVAPVPSDPDPYWNYNGIEFGSDDPEPCEKTYCAWGASCVNTPDGKAVCQCPTKCESTKDIVCGTDNVTYENHCLLRVVSCKARLDTRIKYKGECMQIDLCRDKQCGFGAQCVMSPDGRNSSCVCPDKCPNYGDHVTSHTVCGSDGVDYKNQCELNRAACKINNNITVKFTGKCDPCAGVECAEPEVCQLDSQRNPVCRCGDTCPLEFTPVCGSDGKTYSNECTLRQEACRTRKTLNIIYRGKCSSGINPCMNAHCTSGQECSINKYGIAECLCPPACEPIMRPVCSKDGRTYSSECELKRATCLSGSNIELAYTGVCGEKGPCSLHICQFSATCVERSGTAHCECPVCSSEFDPVCGSDGISYGNECKLRLEACKHRRDIRVLYDGPCNGCEKKKCDFNANCESDGAAEGRCVCPQTCEAKFNNGTVCGTDGVTYTNECELRRTSCQTKQYIIVAYRDNCDLCEGVKCKYGARCEAGECVCPTNCEGSGDEPVCASNMMTYPNECELQKAMCLQSANSSPLSVVFYGDCREKFPVGSLNTTPSLVTVQSSTENVSASPDNAIPGVGSKEACRDIHCDFEATCELGPDNFPRCTCRFDCLSAALVAPSVHKPVCASDLRIYPSLCAMKVEACQRQEELRLRPLELCQGMEVKPCKGEKPVTDPVTGRELDCGNGPFRQDCPSGTYCHQTARFSRCCLKDKNLIEKKSCEDSWFGCCADGKTPAQGPNFAGCPLSCGCNKLGAYSEFCDPKTKKCRCKPGVGGDKCDRCDSGFWGLPKISSGFKGCLPCGCSIFGSVRDDCEQMTGRCVCKPGVQGQKCTVCTSHNKVLGPNGCVSADITTATPTSCKELTCYFGATCVEKGGLAICECHEQCPTDIEPQIVCGSDGQTYNSRCELNQIACRHQKDVVIQALGTCKEDMFPPTDWPVRRYTPLQFTQPDETNSPLSKSTRHLLIPDGRFYYGTATRPLSADKDTRDGENNALAYRPTPATVHLPILGDICTKNSDCSISNSHCVMTACVCLPNYESSIDRRSCIAQPLSTNEHQACSSSPCHQMSTCIDLPDSTFTCICPENYTGLLCDVEKFVKEYTYPAFHGHSYAILKQMDGYNLLVIEIQFKAYTYDGILLYNAENETGIGDFIALTLVNGFVEFKYNLGHGPVIMRSQERIELSKFHTVVVKRYNRDGILKFDDNDEILAQSGGTLKALDLDTVTYIGYVPTPIQRVYQNIGTDKGFQGCIKKLKIGRQEIELQAYRHELVLETKGIHDCSQHSCSATPCLNEGECIAMDDLFRCECPAKFSGTLCEVWDDPCARNPCVYNARCRAFSKESFICLCKPTRGRQRCELEFDADKLIIPEFGGHSYIRFPRVQGIQKSFTIEVAFMPKASNGLILFNGQQKNPLSNFILLQLNGGYLQFRFNVGSGIVDLTSDTALEMRQWYTARVIRKGKQGILQVNNLTMAFAYSKKRMKFPIRAPFYIGSLPKEIATGTKGFKGIIREISINNTPLPINKIMGDCAFDSAISNVCASNVGFYEGVACSPYKNPCLNNAKCIHLVHDYICQCPPGYSGKRCENDPDGIISDFNSLNNSIENGLTIKEIKHAKKDEIKAVKFFGTTYFHYKPKEVMRNGEELTMYETDFTNGFNMYLQNNYNQYYKGLSIFQRNNTDGDEFNSELLRIPSETQNHFEIKFRTVVSDGLLLWKSRSKTAIEYIAIALVDGYTELSFNLGKEREFFAIRFHKKVDDGLWHVVSVKRNRRNGFISIDGAPFAKGKSQPGKKALRASKIWIGGFPSLPKGLPASYYKGFYGCIEYVLVEGEPLHMISGDPKNEIQYCSDGEMNMNDV